MGGAARHSPTAQNVVSNFGKFRKILCWGPWSVGALYYGESWILPCICVPVKYFSFLLTQYRSYYQSLSLLYNLLHHQFPWKHHNSALFTARNEVGARLCLYTCLWFCSRGGGSASVHAGIPPLPEQTHTPGADTPLGADTPRSSACWEIRATRYWNAFLCNIFVHCKWDIMGYNSLLTVCLESDCSHLCSLIMNAFSYQNLGPDVPKIGVCIVLTCHLIIDHHGPKP